MTLNAGANGFVVNDTLGGPDELTVEGEGIGGDSTAQDLGIFGTAISGTLQGDVLRNEVQTARATTIETSMKPASCQPPALVTARFTEQHEWVVSCIALLGSHLSGRDHR